METATEARLKYFYEAAKMIGEHLKRSPFDCFNESSHGDRYRILLEQLADGYGLLYMNNDIDRLVEEFNEPPYATLTDLARKMIKLGGDPYEWAAKIDIDVNELIDNEQA